MSDKIKLPNPSGKFTLICDDCGSRNVAVGDFGSGGGSWTGYSPSIEVHCLDCDNESCVLYNNRRAVEAKDGK